MADTGPRGVYRFGPFHLDVRERRLSRGSAVIPLRLKVFDTLLVLVENAGRLITKQELLDKVWPETSVEENNLNHNVSVLRRALGNQATGQQYIETVPRVGYRFVAPVEGVLAPTTTDSESPVRGIASMAVLPFVNMSADPEGEYFSDGITEEITSALSLVRTLRVTSRTSAFVFKGRSEDVPTIGRCLKVGTVLEGSVRRAGNRIRITAQLVSTEDGFPLWSGRFDREMTDVFAVQEEIAQAIVRTLTSQFVRGAQKSLVKPGTDDLEAYNLYLKGRHHWNKRTVSAMLKAIELFDAALERDGRFALAYASLAECYSLLGWIAFGALAPQEAFPKAKAAALRAIELDPARADAYNALAWSRLVYDWDWPGAERDFLKAIEIDPEFALAVSWYGLSLALRGRMDEAIAYSKRAQ